MSAPRCHVAVIGGGPAGAVTALALRHRIPHCCVVLVAGPADDGTVPPSETLAAAGHDRLRALGLQHVLDAGGARRLSPSDDDGPPSLRNGFLLDRRRFADALLHAAADAGVEIYHRTRLVGTAAIEDGWYLRLEEGDGNVRPLRCHLSVDASGRRARFARRQGANRVRFDLLIGVWAAFDDASVDEVVQLATPDGYWVLHPRTDRAGVVAAFYTDSDLARRLHLNRRAHFLAAVDASGLAAGPLAGATMAHGPVAAPIGSSRLDPLADDDWIAVGDAALATDPLLGRSLGDAIATADRGADAALALLDGDSSAHESYTAWIEERGEAYLQEYQAFHAGERRWPGALFWMRRQPTAELHPNDVLVASEPRSSQPLRLTMHLRTVELERLRRLCRTPDTVAGILTAFRRESPCRAGDRRLVLALQYLLDQGVLRPLSPAIAADEDVGGGQQRRGLAGQALRMLLPGG